MTTQVSLLGGATLNGLLGFINYMKPIEGFEDYLVDVEGNVWSKKCNTLRKLKLGLDMSGYQKVFLCKNGKKFSKTVHRLVAIIFIPNFDGKPCVNHINGIKTDNRVENLEWITYSRNSLHAFQIGLSKSKLTVEQVLLIRNDNRTTREIAKHYNVCHSHISRIKSYKKWTERY